jgi:hypothetical protein
MNGRTFIAGVALTLILAGAAATDPPSPPRRPIIVSTRPLRPGQVQVSRVSTVAVRPTITANALQWRVPLEIQVRDLSGITHKLMPRMELVGAGLEWDRSLERYSGQVRVWLEDKTTPTVGYQLEVPVPMEIGGEASSYAPPRWDVPRAGLPSSDVEIRVVGPRQVDSIAITVAATSSGHGVSLDVSTASLKVPLAGEPMSISPAQQSIQGWGLEAAEVTITTSPSTPGHPLRVSVSSSRGTPRAQTVAIDSVGQGIARVRSGAPGLDTLWVNLENRYRESAIIDHQRPWMFLLWALGGGLVGSFLRTLGKSSGRSSHSVRRFAIRQLVGILCGLLTMGLYSIGFPILPRIVTGQSGGIVTGVIAAVGAFLGRDWLAKMLGDK